MLNPGFESDYSAFVAGRVTELDLVPIASRSANRFQFNLLSSDASRQGVSSKGRAGEACFGSGAYQHN